MRINCFYWNCKNKYFYFYTQVLEDWFYDLGSSWCKWFNLGTCKIMQVLWKRVECKHLLWTICNFLVLSEDDLFPFLGYQKQQVRLWRRPELYLYVGTNCLFLFFCIFVLCSYKITYHDPIFFLTVMILLMNWIIQILIILGCTTASIQCS